MALRNKEQACPTVEHGQTDQRRRGLPQSSHEAKHHVGRKEYNRRLCPRYSSKLRWQKGSRSCQNQPEAAAAGEGAKEPVEITKSSGCDLGTTWESQSAVCCCSRRQRSWCLDSYCRAGKSKVETPAPGRWKEQGGRESKRIKPTF